jgi:hypothetical protein
MKTVTVDLESIGIFRKATNHDIVLGNVVFLVGDGDELHKMIVEEVLNPSDDFKAFTFDGCRYGLYDLWVLNKNSDYLAQINELSGKINDIKNILE